MMRSTKGLMFVVLLAGSTLFAQSPTGDSKTHFAGMEAIKTWAASQSFAECTTSTFTHNTTEWVVVVGSHKDAAPKGDVHFFRLGKDRSYELILSQRSTAGILKAFSVDRGLEIRNEKGAVVLFLPWAALAPDSQEGVTHA